MFSIMALKIGTEVDKISSKYCFLEILSPSTLILGRNLKHELARSCFTLKYFQSFSLLIHSLKPCCQRLRCGRFPQMCKSRRLNYFSIIDSAKLITIIIIIISIIIIIMKLRPGLPGRQCNCHAGLPPGQSQEQLLLFTKHTINIWLCLIIS